MESLSTRITISMMVLIMTLMFSRSDCKSLHHELRHQHNRISNTSVLSMIALHDASDFCGHGCVEVKLRDILEHVTSLKSLQSVFLNFYENGDLVEWEEFRDNKEQYEVYTVNRHRMKHRKIANFTIDSEVYYKRRWRAVDITHTVKHGLRHLSPADDLAIMFIKKSDRDLLNTRFTFNQMTRPFILTSHVTSTRERNREGSRRHRHRRATDMITKPCDEDAAGVPYCCLKTAVINLNEHNDTTFDFWIQPRIFKMTFCYGRCRMSLYEALFFTTFNYSTACCRPKTYEDFEIHYYVTTADGKGSMILRGVLKNFKVTSCECK